MEFDYSPKTQDLIARVSAFMDEHIYPNEKRHSQEVAAGDRWAPLPLMEELKQQARAQGLWNLFLPESTSGAGLTNLEYAPVCEVMGRVLWSPEAFNCSAPDTGNMEVLERYGSEENKARWLAPLLDGKIRSSFAMTEPEVASSDATNIAC
ncbi:MAG: acyl-CoA dehydrogenase, partial [Betaproteobacteria bacterium]